jgi:hypothetical protein
MDVEGDILMVVALWGIPRGKVRMVGLRDTAGESGAK